MLEEGGSTVRGQNLIKLLKAIECLSKPEGATIKELMEELGIERRSVYRLIQTMESLGFPLYDEKLFMDREKRWKFEETYLKKLPNVSVPEMKLDLSEIVALHLIRAGSKTYRGTDIERKVDSAFAKLGAFVPEDVVKNLPRIRTLFLMSDNFSKDYSGKEEIIDTLAGAMLRQETHLIKYHSFGKDRITRFRIDPLYFFENRGGLYAFVRATDFGDIRTLAVERIQELEPTGEAFDYPEDFDPEERLSTAFDIVFDDIIDTKIWISKGQARYVKERRLTRNQKITENEDGSIILEMQTSGWWSVKHWVLSLGAEAEVLEPEELRKEVAEEIEGMAQKYGLKRD